MKPISRCGGAAVATSRLRDDFFAMMSRVTFTGLFFSVSPLPPTYLLSGTNLWQRARTVSNCTGLRTINRQDATTYVCE